jgi:hypothetical protein
MSLVIVRTFYAVFKVLKEHFLLPITWLAGSVTYRHQQY